MGSPDMGDGSVTTQVIYCGDNLHMLRDLPRECIDLIYIDPPSIARPGSQGHAINTNHSPLFHEWPTAVERYIQWMTPRVEELWRVLKHTGSFYYHCDWRVDAHVRLMLEDIFGPDGFKSHIIWPRTSSKRLIHHAFSNNHDSILLYTKSETYTFNRQYVPFSERNAAHMYKYVEPDTGRRYRLESLASSGKNQSVVPSNSLVLLDHGD